MGRANFQVSRAPPTMLCPGAGGSYFRSPLWLKGRRDLLSRNDFNWQRLETARIATLSQQLSDAEMENGAGEFSG